MRLIVDRADNRIGELFPALAGMGIGIALFDREHGIEQQHALTRPVFEKAVIGRRDAQIRVQFLVDILQRRRDAHAWAHRKRQAVGLIVAVIGVLAQDHHAHLVERGGVERVEIVAALGEDAHAQGPAFLQEGLELGHVGLCELATQRGFPAIVEFDISGGGGGGGLAHHGLLKSGKKGARVRDKVNIERPA